MSKRGSRPVRINRIARKIARRSERQRFSDPKRWGVKKPLKRKEGKPREKPFIAYDLETTRIAKGTPEPRYITGFGLDFVVSRPLCSLDDLRRILIERFLLPETSGLRFVAWNGNNFDVFLIGQALLHSPEYVLRPYLTRSKALRGLRVSLRQPVSIPGKKKPIKLSWEFLDGMAMTIGNAPMTLKKFTQVFAPDYVKLDGPDFEKEEFDSRNLEHVRYAERDSEGLYHAMMKAQSIVMDNFGVPLYPTIGNTGIRIFQRNMPSTVQVWEPPYTVLQIIRDYVMRGGFCFLARKYSGPIYKYDLNQAYAAAMREARLPAGRCIHSGGVNKYASVAIYKVNAEKRGNLIPFYWRDQDGDSIFSRNHLTDAWITSIEYNQLKKEGWNLQVTDGYFWDETFTMKDYVDRLEKLRRESPGGPSGAQGTMVKALGNNSYGKTCETLDGLELLLALDQPEGFYEYQAETDELQNVWFKFNRPVPREYHQPQIGAFITAHVRMVVRRAALVNPQAWLYADTDCVVFSEPVKLPIDSAKYGLWKIEVSGCRIHSDHDPLAIKCDCYRMIQKKVYAKHGFPDEPEKRESGTVHAKGMNIKRLNEADFIAWYNGESPRQVQLQRQNFIRVMTGAEMFVSRAKVGEKFKPVALA